MRRPALPLTVITLIVSLVGLADASIGRVWDLFVMFLVLVIVQMLVLLSASGNRVPISLRPDLARWAKQRSQRTGEPLNDVVDRSVAWFQHGLYGSSHTDDE
jgi:hypothetical protein